MAHLGQVQEALETLTQRDIAVLAICFGSPHEAREYREHYALPLDLASDSTRSLYHAYGLGQGRTRDVLRPRAILTHARLLLRGFRASETSPKQDIYQLGGDFVIDREGRIAHAYASVAGDDRAPVPALVSSAIRVL
ncbi:MAG: peroxiredoxin-like family protein [Deltaproteobacteria bacterium]|nr:peroxiredoxin-like family protein [Deltaproteobacteria bacterium]